jgi:hypothetical protein
MNGVMHYFSQKYCEQDASKGDYPHIFPNGNKECAVKNARIKAKRPLA